MRVERHGRSVIKTVQSACRFGIRMHLHDRLSHPDGERRLAAWLQSQRAMQGFLACLLRMLCGNRGAVGNALGILWYELQPEE
jgi:hypothetical protein